jgi:hypothetical protein
MTTQSSKSADDLRDDIERTRAELGDTAAALAARADVPARMKGSASRTAARAADRLRTTAAQAADAAGQLRGRVAGGAGPVRDLDVRRPVPMAVLTAAGAAVLAGTVWLIRRRSS